MIWQLLISWRNLWRNPRRTSVILVSIVVGIWMMLFMGAIMWGMVQSMLESSLSNLTGHVQIHQVNFLDDPAVENHIHNPEVLEEILTEILPEDSQVAWRVRKSVVANNAHHSGGFTLVGTDFPTARKMTFLKEAVLSGEMPSMESRNGILVGRKFLENFESRIGNKLILMAQDTTGEINSMAFRVEGSFDTFLESNETGFAFAPLPVVQKFLSLGKGVSEVSIILPDIEQTGAIAKALRERLDSTEFSITEWEESVPMVTAYIQIWNYFSYVWGLIVFIAMGFGIVNTMLMAVYERIREFGLVRALGTRPTRIVVGVVLESSLLLLVGLLIGNTVGFITIGWLNIHGIDLAAFSSSSEMFGLSRMVYPVIQMRDVFIFNGLVFGLGLLVSLYPAIKAARFTPVQAMAHFK